MVFGLTLALWPVSVDSGPITRYLYMYLRRGGQLIGCYGTMGTQQRQIRGHHGGEGTFSIDEGIIFDMTSCTNSYVEPT